MPIKARVALVPPDGPPAAAMDRIGEHPKAYVIDFSGMSMIDSTAAATVEGFARKARRQGVAMFVAGARPPIRRMLMTHGARPPTVRFRAKLEDALKAARQKAGAERKEAGE